MPSLVDCYNLAAVHHQQARAGRRPKRLYEQVLQADPRHAQALNNLGVIRFGQRRLDNAISLYRRALVVEPHYADALSNLGLALKDQCQLAEAIACYQRLSRIATPPRGLPGITSESLISFKAS